MDASDGKQDPRISLLHPGRVLLLILILGSTVLADLSSGTSIGLLHVFPPSRVCRGKMRASPLGRQATRRQRAR